MSRNFKFHNPQGVYFVSFTVVVPMAIRRIDVFTRINYKNPAPATMEILKNIPVVKEDIPFEATTPTGAGILAALAVQFTDKINFNTEKIGYVVGNK